MTESRSRRVRVRDAVPRSRLFWALEAVGVLLLVVAATVATGEMAGLFGIWGVTFLVGTLALFAVYRFWQSG